jgi:RNA polymerase sigma-70 factor (ECF subfamily)
MPSEPRPDPEHLLALARSSGGAAVGQLLEVYRNYLTLLARTQNRRHLQGRIDPSDVVQETFLAAHRDFARFRGTTEAELVSWLRQILAARLADLVRHHVGARRRDVRLERRLADELGQSFSFTVTALDAYGNVDTDYTGTVHFTSSDPWPCCRRTPC